MSVSYWTRSPRPDVRDADLVIVGGGVCGLAAAVHAEARGLSVVVLEAAEVGAGASSRNAGFLMRGAAESYARAVQTWGHDRAAELWRFSEDNLRLLRGLGVESLPSYRPTPSCILALNEDEADELERSAEWLIRDGFAAALHKPVDDAASDNAWKTLAPRVGMVNPADASVDPDEVQRMLRGRLSTPVLERHEVIGWDADETCVTVRTRSLHVRAARVLLCVNAYAARLVPSLAGVVTPNRGQMIAVEAPNCRLDHAYYANFGSEYFRRTPEGVLVVGGFRTYYADQEAGYETQPAAPVQDELERFAARLLGRDRVDPLARWAGTMGFTADGLPLLGPIDDDPRTWFCGGFTGHGMSLGVRTALAAIDAMHDGAPSPFPMDRAMAAPSP